MSNIKDVPTMVMVLISYFHGMALDVQSRDKQNF